MAPESSENMMIPNDNRLKRFPVRWPMGFWKRVGKIAIERETSVQGIVTEAVSQYLGIPVETKTKQAAQE